MFQQRSQYAVDTYNEHLEELLAKCIENAMEVRARRRRIYDSTILFEDYLLNGPQDVLYEIHKKNLRILNMLRTGEWNPADDGPIWDSIYDIINYATLLYAVLKMSRVQHP